MVYSIEGNSNSVPKTNHFQFTGPDGNPYTLSFKEKAFCESYLSYVGNGTQAVINAGYEAKNETVAAAIASENLRKPHISQYINLLLDKAGFNEASTKKQHSFLLNQFADLSIKARAIDMYYRIKGLYASNGRKQQFEDEFHEFMDEEIEEELAKRIARRVEKIKVS